MTQYNQFLDKYFLELTKFNEQNMQLEEERLEAI